MIHEKNSVAIYDEIEQHIKKTLFTRHAIYSDLLSIESILATIISIVIAIIVVLVIHVFLFDINVIGDGNWQTLILIFIGMITGNISHKIYQVYSQKKKGYSLTQKTGESLVFGATDYPFRIFFSNGMERKIVKIGNHKDSFSNYDKLATKSDDLFVCLRVSLSRDIDTYTFSLTRSERPDKNAFWVEEVSGVTVDSIRKIDDDFIQIKFNDSRSIKLFLKTFDASLIYKDLKKFCNIVDV